MLSHLKTETCHSLNLFLSVALLSPQHMLFGFPVHLGNQGLGLSPDLTGASGWRGGLYTGFILPPGASTTPGARLSQGERLMLLYTLTTFII